MRKIKDCLWISKQKLIFVVEVLIRKKIPVVVYQMGKVGSSSVANSLKGAGISPVFHIHRMNPTDINRIRKEYKNRNQIPPANDLFGDYFRRNIVEKNKAAKYIALFRNPIERNFSAFFQNFKRYVGVKPDDYNGSIDDLIKVFKNEYDHETPLNWFDKEIKKVLGIDIFEKRFPKGKGYLVCKNSRAELLILKTSLDDSIKADAVKKFLDLKIFRITAANIGANKDYNKFYKEFKTKVKLDNSYLTKFNNSKACKYFFTDKELKENLKWQKRK